jgi:hypothetical protein
VRDLRDRTVIVSSDRDRLVRNEASTNDRNHGGKLLSAWALHRA